MDQAPLGVMGCGKIILLEWKVRGVKNHCTAMHRIATNPTDVTNQCWGERVVVETFKNTFVWLGRFYEHLVLCLHLEMTTGWAFRFDCCSKDAPPSARVAADVDAPGTPIEDPFSFSWKHGEGFFEKNCWLTSSCQLALVSLAQVNLRKCSSQLTCTVILNKRACTNKIRGKWLCFFAHVWCVRKMILVMCGMLWASG